MTPSEAAPQSLSGALAAEISRVTALREQYNEAGRLIGSMQGVAPGILLMTETLRRAVAAAGSHDIEGQLRALNDLGGFTG